MERKGIRKGLEGRPLDSSKLDCSKIPKLQDWIEDGFCQFCGSITANENMLSCNNCFQPEDSHLQLVINQPDGSRSNNSNPGNITRRFF